MRDHGRWASTSWEMTLTRVIEGRRCRRRRNETEGRKEGRRDGRWKVKGEKTTKFFRSDPYHGRTLWRQWCSAVGYRWKSSNQRERPRGCGFWRQSFVFFESCNVSVRVYPQYVYTDSYIYIYVYTYTCTNIFIDDSRLPFKPSLMCLFSMRTQADARSSLFIPRSFFDLDLSDFCPSCEIFLHSRKRSCVSWSIDIDLSSF